MALTAQTVTSISPVSTRGKITTQHKIGKITYLIESAHSETAKDTIDQKIEKLIFRDIQRNATTI